jgi:hypothetical protein
LNEIHGPGTYRRDRRIGSGLPPTGVAMPTILPLAAFDLELEAVQDRFGWALRQGHPQWLWPDVDVAGWQGALDQFERVAREVLTSGRAHKPLDGRAEDVGVAAYTSGMGPLLGFWLGRGLVRASAKVGALLDLHYRHNVLRMERMARRASEAAGLLARNGVRTVVLKGMDTAFSIFPQPGVRPLSDIDLLIDPADRARAGALLSQIGLRPGRISDNPPEQNWRRADTRALPCSLAFVHADDPWSIDLQTSLNRRYSYGAPVVDLDSILDNERLMSWGLAPDVRRLPPDALVLHLACHASCGLESLSLLRLVELVLAIRAGLGSSQFTWEGFAALAKRARASAMAYPALHLAERLAPGTVPGNVLSLCARQAPRAVREVIGRLAPRNAQKVLRCSLQERFMWTPSRRHMVLQILREAVPPKTPVSNLLWIYRMRMWRLVRGTLTR